MPEPRIIDLGNLSYAAAYQRQLEHHAAVLASRDSINPETARILLVEHDPPVITIPRRPEARNHLLAGAAALRAAGIELAETDRGGDITYHGPGQLVAYPIVDLDRLRLGLHEYMRLLEGAIIDVCADFGLAAERDPTATGVWIRASHRATDLGSARSVLQSETWKICAMGVRVRRWVTFHGLALNVTTNLDHFNLIVPCGLAGRSVTSMNAELGPATPPMAAVKAAVAGRLCARLAEVTFSTASVLQERPRSGTLSDPVGDRKQ